MQSVDVGAGHVLYESTSGLYCSRGDSTERERERESECVCVLHIVHALVVTTQVFALYSWSQKYFKPHNKHVVVNTDNFKPFSLHRHNRVWDGGKDDGSRVLHTQKCQSL